MDKSTRFFKQYGAEERDDLLLAVAADYYVLFFGFGTDSLGSYRWRKHYNHKPDCSEVRADIESLINECVSDRILSGMMWDGKPVWLSEENQINFRSAVSVPVRFKLGEDTDGNPVYHTFTTQKALSAFNTAVADWVSRCLNEGWDEKDAVDYDALLDTAPKGGEE